jgi:hypothetical protein
MKFGTILCISALIGIGIFFGTKNIPLSLAGTIFCMILIAALVNILDSLDEIKNVLVKIRSLLDEINNKITR